MNGAIFRTQGRFPAVGSWHTHLRMSSKKFLTVEFHVAMDNNSKHNNTIDNNTNNQGSVRQFSGDHMPLWQHPEGRYGQNRVNYPEASQKNL